MSRKLAPGYCIVEQPGSISLQTGLLVRNRNSSAARYFEQLNAGTSWVKPGQILIVADPNSMMTEQTLRLLHQAKQQVNNNLVGVSTDEASFLQRNYGMIAGITTAGDKIFGAIGDAGEKILQSYRNHAKKNRGQLSKSVSDTRYAYRTTVLC